MPSRVWKGLLVTTDEDPGDRDTKPSSRIVKVEIEDVSGFVASFPDELADALDVIARTLLFEREREFWDESVLLEGCDDD